MSDIVHPLSAAAVGIANLRYFRPPLSGERMVWHSVQDLHACMTLPRDLRREFKAKLRSSSWSRDTVAVMTEAGPTTLAPHWMAQGLIDSMVENGFAKPEIEHAYVAGMVAATNIYHAELGLSDLESLNFSLRAFRNENGIPGPHPVIKMMGGEE